MASTKQHKQLTLCMTLSKACTQKPMETIKGHCTCIMLLGKAEASDSLESSVYYYLPLTHTTTTTILHILEFLKLIKMHWKIDRLVSIWEGNYTCRQHIEFLFLTIFFNYFYACCECAACSCCTIFVYYQSKMITINYCKMY